MVLLTYLLTTALLTNASSATTVRAYNMHMHMHMRMRMRHMRRACFPYPGPAPHPTSPTPRASRPARRARAPSKESDPRVHPPLGLSLRRVRCARGHDGRDRLLSMDGA